MWGHTPRKIPRSPKSGPRANKHTNVNSGPPERRWTNHGSPEAVGAQGQLWCPGSNDRVCQHQGMPMPGAGGQAPPCVSLETSLGILNAEHPCLPSTNNINQVINQEEEHLMRIHNSSAFHPGLVLSLNMWISFRLPLHLVLFEVHSRNPNPFRNN